MIDIHCHILPGIDDGPKSWDVAVEMCQMAVADGITHIVATPHANHVHAYDRARNEEVRAQLLERTGGNPALSLGCDFHFSYENLQLLRADRSQFAIGSTRYMLVELSDYAIPPSLGENLRELMASGIRPVLTHPERNPLLQRRPEQILDLAEGGTIIQITAGAFTGQWGKVPQRLAGWLLEHNAVHVVASDAHNLNRRPPLMSPARDVVKLLQGETVASALFEGNPGAIATDGDLPYFPVVIR